MNKHEIYDTKNVEIHTFVGTVTLMILVALGIVIWQGAWMQAFFILSWTFAVLGAIIIITIFMYLISLIVPVLGYCVCSLFSSEDDE